MNFGNFRFESLIIAVGIAALGLFIGNGVREFSAGNRVVSVKGLAQMEVDADKVTWPLVYKDINNDMKALYNSLNTKNEKIVKFLTSKGIPESDIAISAPKVVDLLADQYQSQPVTNRYNATSIVIVTSNNVPLVREVMEQQSELLKDGVAIIREDYSNRVEYEFTGLNTIKPQMIEEATANARAAAEKFAEDSESKLGKIKRATQGQFSIYDRDAYTPYIKSVRVVNTVDYMLED